MLNRNYVCYPICCYRLYHQNVKLKYSLTLCFYGCPTCRAIHIKDPDMDNSLYPSCPPYDRPWYKPYVTIVMLFPLKGCDIEHISYLSCPPHERLVC